MSQSLSDDEFKYTLIEKHTYSLVKSIEKFLHFILGKHTQLKVPLHVVNFFSFSNTSFKKTYTLSC